MKNNALIGFSGFVGSTLLKQTHFDATFRSSTIKDIDEQLFDTVVCAAAPAQKWIANQNPIADRKNIESLVRHLSKIQCRTFILISTVDVFDSPIGADETTPVEEEGLHAYGFNRRYLEKFVAQNFPDHLIVRLPGLVGPGLKKNIIFDFLNNNGISRIDSRGVFQFYPMVNLWPDIQVALHHRLKIIHFTSSPISVADVSYAGFGKHFAQETEQAPARYDIQTCHAHLFGAEGRYQYTQREIIQAIRAYAQSEATLLKNEKAQ